MEWRSLHGWEVSPEEAERIQVSLAERLAPAGGPALEPPTTIAGAAVSSGAAAVVVLRASDWSPVEMRKVALPSSPPGGLRYRRGLLAFTLGPPLLRAFEAIRCEVDVALFRAHGIAHPRRCGMAAHLGLLLGRPSIGCAEALLTGECSPPGPARGDWTPVTDGGDVLGACLRTRPGSKPVYASPGYGLGVEEAVGIVLSSARSHRLPEPLRQARLFARGA